MDIEETIINWDRNVATNGSPWEFGDDDNNEQSSFQRIDRSPDYWFN